MLFFESIEAHPADWSALIFKDKETTFGELRQNINIAESTELLK